MNPLEEKTELEEKIEQEQKREKKKFWKGVLCGAAVTLCLAVGVGIFCTAIVSGIHIFSSSEKKQVENKLQIIQAIIDKYYLGDVDEEKLIEGAIKGYIEGLGDPYTEYISKEDMQDYMDDTTGNFVGVGIYMVKDTESNKIMILSPIKGSPA